MKNRKLLTDEIVPSLTHAEKITIYTSCPDKWRFVDLETGDIWKWDHQTKQFKRADQMSIVALDGDEN
jgi:hypothetical protein